jgi:hypothetical protein
METDYKIKNGDSMSVNQKAAVPRILLTDTDRRAYAARLAIALSSTGCEVSAVSTHGHPIEKTSTIRRTFPYSALRPLDSLEAAIGATAPDIIVPCCDRGVQHLHELYERACAQSGLGHDVAALIRRSLGSPESYPIVSARFDLLRLAEEEGLRIPHTSVVNAVDDIKAWQAKQSFPWVLKSDGSWGGRGVRIAHTAQEAEELFLTINRPFGLGRTIKRLCVNRDPFWIQPWWRGLRPSVIVQSHIQGRPANCGVVCWEGRILAGIGVEVMSTEGPLGPASVVRTVDNPEMMFCAERIARRLGLSGLFGLDFMIEDGTGAAYLIEMNPRCTPVCHLQLGRGRDLISALWAQLSGQPSPDTPPVTENDMIAYFPQAWTGDRQLLDLSFHDVPQGEPDLVEELLWSWPERSLLFRGTNYLHNMTNEATSASRSTPASGS